MFVKDPSTKMVINTDDSYYKSLLAIRASEKRNQDLENRSIAVENELQDIKKLLQQVLDGKNNNG